MSTEEAGGVNLEGVMFRLLEYQSQENVDQIDTMIMMGLVNLLGIVSVMNKQAPFAPGTTRQAAGDPLMPALISMLAQGQSQPEGRGGPSGMNPALLMSLLGSGGQRPENALLMGLLSSMLQQPPPAYNKQPPREERERRTAPQRTGSGEMGADNAREAGRPGGFQPWDRRLG